MVYKLFDKKSALLYKSSGSGTINEPSYQLANELHNSITKKLKKKSLFIFRDNIQGIDLADMQFLSKNNKKIK